MKHFRYLLKRKVDQAMTSGSSELNSVARLLLVVLFLGGLPSTMLAQSNGKAATDCSTAKLESKAQRVNGDRELAPFQMRLVALSAGSCLRLMLRGGSDATNQYDLSLYAPGSVKITPGLTVLDLSYAVCLVRDSASAVFENGPPAKKEPASLVSGCHSKFELTKDTKTPVSPTPPKKGKQQEHKTVPAPKVIATEAYIQYLAPVAGTYAIVIEFYGSGMGVDLACGIDSLDCSNI